MFNATVMIMIAGLVVVPCRAEFRDPTKPVYPQAAMPNATEKSNIELVLSAIWITPHSRRATINGVTGKQGQTLVIEHKQTLPTAQAIAQTNTAPKPITTSSAPPTNVASNVLEKLLTVSPTESGSLLTTGGNNAQQAQYANAASGIQQQPTVGQNSDTAYLPALPISVKIISIHKNSVVIEQDGERKTLHLIQRLNKVQ
ncbi:MAG: hypothetical protein ACXWAS_06245 [Methylobacter sp.]